MIYRFFIDPLLYSSHSCVAGLILPNEHVIDVCCGNGTLGILIAESTSSNVTGVDMDPLVIRKASMRGSKRKDRNLKFLVGDATDLSQFSDKEFTTGIISLAIHQFSPEDGLKVLMEMKRISRRIIVLDYGWPMKQNLLWWMTRLIEFIAGGEHYRNFKRFMSKGGQDPILKHAGLRVQERQHRGQGTLVITSCDVQDSDKKLTDLHAD